MKRNREFFENLDTSPYESASLQPSKKFKKPFKETLHIFLELLSTIKESQQTSQAPPEFVGNLEKFCSQIIEGNSTKIFLELIILKYQTSSISTSETLQWKIISQIQFEMTQKTTSLLKYVVQRESNHLCPITKSIMSSPCTLKKSGIVYERDSILEALKYNLKCPVTNMLLTEEYGKVNIDDLIVVNYDKKSAIDSFKSSFYEKAVKIMSIISEINVCMKNLNGESSIVSTADGEGRNIKKKRKKKRGKEGVGNKFVLSYELVSNALEIVDTLRKFSMVTDGIMKVQESLLSSQPFNPHFFDSYLAMIGNYERNKEYEKSLGLLNNLLVKGKSLNSISQDQIESCLNLKLKILLKCPTSQCIGDDENKICSNSYSNPRSIVMELIDHYTGCKKFDDARALFYRYQGNYFRRKTVQNLLIEASVTSKKEAASKIYYDIAVKFFNKKMYEEAKKYLLQAVEKDKKNIEAREKLITICMNLGSDSKGYIIDSYLSLGELNPQKREVYYKDAFEIDKENKIVMEKYLNVLLENENIEEYMNVSNSDTGRKVLLNQMMDLKHNNINLKNRVEKIEEKLQDIFSCEMKKLIMLSVDELRTKRVVLSDELIIKDHCFKVKASISDGNLSLFLFCLKSDDMIKEINFSLRLSINENVYYKSLKKQFYPSQGWGGCFCNASELEGVGSNELECVVSILSINTLSTNSQSSRSQYGLFDDEEE